MELWKPGKRARNPSSSSILDKTVKSQGTMPFGVGIGIGVEKRVDQLPIPIPMPIATPTLKDIVILIFYGFIILDAGK